MRKNLIIGGASRSGKTTLARRIAREFGYSRIPGDSFMTAFGQLFPKLGIGHHEFGRADRFDAAMHERICANSRDFFVRFWQATHEDEQVEFVFDSFHILPAQLPLRVLEDNFAFVFMGFPRATPERMLEQVRSSTEGDDWLQHMPDDIVLRLFSVFIEVSKKLEEQCERMCLAFIDSGDDFAAAQELAYARAVELAGLRS